MKPARGQSGVNHDFNFYNDSGAVWNGSAYVSWADGSYASYRIAATELGSSGRYPIPTPPAGAADYELRVRGGSLAASYVVWEDVIGGVTELSTETIDELAAAIADAGGVVNYSPVSVGGQISVPLVIGDDYLIALGNALEWNVVALPGVAFGDAECSFGIKNSTGAGFVVDGVVASVDADTWKLRFEIPKAEWTGLAKGDYEWSAEVRDSSGNEVTRVRNADFNYKVRLVEKQT